MLGVPWLLLLQPRYLLRLRPREGGAIAQLPVVVGAPAEHGVIGCDRAAMCEREGDLLGAAQGWTESGLLLTHRPG